MRKVVVVVLMRALLIRSVGIVERQDIREVPAEPSALAVPFGRRRGKQLLRETVVPIMNVAVKSRLLRLIPLPVKTRLFHRGTVNKYHHEMTA